MTRGTMVLPALFVAASALAGLEPKSPPPVPPQTPPKPAAPPAASAESAVSREPKKLGEGVWAMMTKGGANAGWITFGDSVIAIDSGRNPEDAEEILAQIAKTAGKKPVAYLVLTSDFGPHAGGAAVFARRGATVVTYEALVSAVQGVVGKSPVVGVGTRLLLSRPERHVIVRHLGPADSAGDLAVLVSEEKIMFAGDLVESVFLPPLFSKTIDPEGWIAALNLLDSLKATAVVPGYGLIGPPAAIAATRDYLAHAVSIARKIVEERTPEDFVDTRVMQPDVKIAGLPPELEKSHAANVRALIAWVKAKGAAPAPK